MALGVLFLGGCLLPQEDDILEPIVLRNRPPRIVESQVSPQQRVTFGDDCKVPFEVWLEDPDVNDTVRYRWYLDYNPDPNAPTLVRVPFEVGNFVSTAAAVKAVTDLGPGGTVVDLLPGDHVVTFLAFDGFLDTFDGPGSEPEAEPIPGTDGGKDPRYSTSYSWFVTVDSTADCDLTSPVGTP